MCVECRRGITCFSDYEAVLTSFRGLQAEVPGCLGEYHLKLAMDHMDVFHPLSSGFAAGAPLV